jgi:hypothetical protein
MIRAFLSKRAQALSGWWRAPASRRDRVFGAFVGTLGGFWVGVLLSVLLLPTPISFAAIGLAALSSSTVGLVLGIAFPKATTLLYFPFSVFGISGGT